MASAEATLAKRPRGDRIPQHELEQRLGIVEDLMVAGFPSRKIQEELERQRSWARSTVARYIAQVRERWQIEREAERATDVEASLARLASLSFKAEKDKAWSAVRGFEQLMADIRGVRAPERVDHRVAAIVKQVPSAPADREPAQLALVEGLEDNVLDALERAADEKLKALPAHSPDDQA